VSDLSRSCLEGRDRHGPAIDTAIHRLYSQGKQTAKSVSPSLLVLTWLDHLASADNGETFALRLVA
jgi:hypothetical protein